MNTEKFKEGKIANTPEELNKVDQVALKKEIMLAIMDPGNALAFEGSLMRIRLSQLYFDFIMSYRTGDPKYGDNIDKPSGTSNTIYDPMTGMPLAGQGAKPRFDSMTGRRLDEASGAYGG